VALHLPQLLTLPLLPPSVERLDLRCGMSGNQRQKLVLLDHDWQPMQGLAA